MKKYHTMFDLEKDYISESERRPTIEYLIQRVRASIFPISKKVQLMSLVLRAYNINSRYKFNEAINFIYNLIEYNPSTFDISPTELGSFFIAEIRNRLLIKDKNWISIIVGQTGSGKSTTAISLALAIDPSFSIDRIVFTPKEYIEQVKDLKKGQVIIWDETGVGFSSKDFQSRISKNVAKVFQTMRFKNGATIMTAPVSGMINKDARRLVHTLAKAERIVPSRRINILKIYQYKVSLFDDNLYAKKIKYSIGENVFQLKEIAITRPRLRGPYGKIFKEYEKKKSDFFNKIVINKALNEMQSEEESKEEKERKRWELINEYANKVVNTPFEYATRVKGKRVTLSETKIAARFQISLGAAKLIKEKAFQKLKEKGMI